MNRHGSGRVIPLRTVREGFLESDRSGFDLVTHPHLFLGLHGLLTCHIVSSAFGMGNRDIFRVNHNNEMSRSLMPIFSFPASASLRGTGGVFYVQYFRKDREIVQLWIISYNDEECTHGDKMCSRAHRMD